MPKRKGITTMMTMKEINKWCEERIAMHRTYLFDMDGHYKIRFENGDTYEWKSRDERREDGRYERINIWLNEELVCNNLYDNTWLDNGVYGKKLIEGVA